MPDLCIWCLLGTCRPADQFAGVTTAKDVPALVALRYCRSLTRGKGFPRSFSGRLVNAVAVASAPVLVMAVSVMGIGRAGILATM